MKISYINLKVLIKEKFLIMARNIRKKLFQIEIVSYLKNKLNIDKR